jgi:hypothetical protein
VSRRIAQFGLLASTHFSFQTITITPGFVGYFTNVLALEMTFYPVEFWGIEIFRIKTEPWGLFGWQGIIPTKAHKMGECKRVDFRVAMPCNAFLFVECVISRLE